MSELGVVLLIVAVWTILNFVMPRLGVPTG
jgi:uncharacterized membrane protein YkgB